MIGATSFVNVTGPVGRSAGNALPWNANSATRATAWALSIFETPDRIIIARPSARDRYLDVTVGPTAVKLDRADTLDGGDTQDIVPRFAECRGRCHLGRTPLHGGCW